MAFKNSIDSIVLLVLALFTGLVSLSAPASVQLDQVSPQGPAPIGPEYVGASVCASCHEKQYQQWQQSHHFQSMQPATSEFVLGDFHEARVNSHNITTRLYVEKGQYFVETLNKKGEKAVFPIAYTFGFYPLQQYLIELDQGHIQALSVAWDSRSKEQGGQRWFHLQPNENVDTEHPFFWTRHFQNWNGRCADCHSTDVKRNYDQEQHGFKTTWSEINVGCESCHGPGARHIELIKADSYSALHTGFVSWQPALNWVRAPNQATASPKGKPSTQEIDTCGSCHALRVPLGEDKFTRSDQTQAVSRLSLHSSQVLQLPLPPHYFIDGQIREEVFVLGSFLQSKMFEQGVTCSNCHDPHTNRVLIEGNGLCAQCHDTKVFDTPKHHHHPIDSQGAKCVNCHMPWRTFMQVDDRRDHSFTLPRPQLSEDLGVPNACTQCHEEQSNLWAIEMLNQWGIKERARHWAYTLDRILKGDALALPEAKALVAKGGLPQIMQASLLASLAPMPSEISLELVLEGLKSKNPVVRRGAVAGLENFPPEVRWAVISEHLHDPSLSVRFELARIGASLLNLLPLEQQKTLADLISEYRSALLIMADSPGVQINIAQLELGLGQVELAEKALLHALRIEPNFVPALVNLADFYRDAGHDDKAQPLLLRALKIAPDSGAAQHSYGLYLIRHNQYEAAMAHLKSAIETEDAHSHYAYVYAVALDSQNKTQEAIEVLIKANDKWPNQYQVLVTLLEFLDKTQQQELKGQYLEALKQLAPNSPALRK